MFFKKQDSPSSRDDNVNTSFYKHALFPPANNESVSFLTKPIYKFFIFCFSNPFATFFHWQIANKYLLTITTLKTLDYQKMIWLGSHSKNEVSPAKLHTFIHHSNKCYYKRA